MNAPEAGKCGAVLPRWLVRFSALALFAASAAAAQLTGSFNVVIRFNPTIESAFCVKGPGLDTFGAVVTVVCATGAVVDIQPPKPTTGPWTPLHGGAYRFHRLAGNELPGTPYAATVDSYTGAGTVTSWRLVNLADREYLEILIGW